MTTQKRLRDLAFGVIGAAIEVHKELGPGLLESIYEDCLYYELTQRGFMVERQVRVPVYYKEIELGCQLRMDLVVENDFVVEVKAVKQLQPVHAAQLMTYLKLAKKYKGVVINFYTDNITSSVMHRVHQAYSSLPLA